MTKYKLYWLLFSLPIFFTSCINDQEELFAEETPEEEPIFGYDGVEEELWEYYERFEAEAAERGYSINLRASNVTGEIAALDGDGVAGQCTYQSHLPNHVTIDLEFWSDASDRAKEFVIFHELGHCELGRDHREAATNTGTCISIMRSGLEGCRDNYNALTRETYLDELFDPRFWDEL